jgi:hypothetical protein
MMPRHEPEIISAITGVEFYVLAVSFSVSFKNTSTSSGNKISPAITIFVTSSIAMATE